CALALATLIVINSSASRDQWLVGSPVLDEYYIRATRANRRISSPACLRGHRFDQGPSAPPPRGVARSLRRYRLYSYRTTLTLKADVPRAFRAASHSGR